MMSKHVKLLRLGKKNAKELTTGSVDPAAIADSCLEDPRAFRGICQWAARSLSLGYGWLRWLLSSVR